MPQIKLSEVELNLLLEALRDCPGYSDRPSLQSLQRRLAAIHIHTAACDACGAPFEPAKPDQRFCSTRCRVADHRRRFQHPVTSPALPDNASANPALSDVVQSLTREKCVAVTVSALPPGWTEQRVPHGPAPCGPRNRRCWYPVQVRMALKDDGSLSPVSVADGDRREYLRRIGCTADGPVTQAALPDGFPWFSAEPDKSATGVIVPGVWRWCFAVHLDGTPWLGDLVVPPEAIALAQKQLAAFQSDGP